MIFDFGPKTLYQILRTFDARLQAQTVISLEPEKVKNPPPPPESAKRGICYEKIGTECRVRGPVTYGQWRPGCYKGSQWVTLLNQEQVFALDVEFQDLDGRKMVGQFFPRWDEIWWDGRKEPSDENFEELLEDQLRTRIALVPVITDMKTRDGQNLNQDKETRIIWFPAVYCVDLFPVRDEDEAPRHSVRFFHVLGGLGKPHTVYHALPLTALHRLHADPRQLAAHTLPRDYAFLAPAAALSRWTTRGWRLPRGIALPHVGGRTLDWGEALLHYVAPDADPRVAKLLVEL